MSQSLHVFVIGASGLIGNEVVKMLVDLSVNDTQVVLRGVCDSKTAIYLRDSSVIPGWKVNKDVRWRVSDYASSSSIEQFDYDGSREALQSFTVCVPPLHSSFDSNISRGSANTCIATVIIDCTASEVPSSLYGSWLSAGIHVVTANKKVNSGDFDYYRECRDAYRSLDKGGMWLTEATCGAGLPVIKTIRSLVQSGDTIESIKGIFSGTMSYLFNTWKAPEPFSELVSMAKISGYTEPDPRQDLNGLDVARKVVILARECGLNVSLGDVSIEGLVPESLVDCSVEEFITKFPLHNESLSAKAIDAASRNCVLRFLGSVDIINKKVSVSLTEVDSSHVFASLTGADNILEITSARYGPNGGSTPMIIRGPGAGAAVTAGGVVGDVLDLARIILHRS